MALVVLAGLAALAGAIFDYWAVTLALGAGIVLHGVGWVYLAKRAELEADVDQ